MKPSPILDRMVNAVPIGILVLLLALSAMRVMAQDGFAPPPVVQPYTIAPRTLSHTITTGGPSPEKLYTTGVATVDLVGDPEEVDCQRSIRSVRAYVVFHAGGDRNTYELGRKAWQATVTVQFRAVPYSARLTPTAAVNLGPTCTLTISGGPGYDSIPEAVCFLDPAQFVTTQHPHYDATPAGTDYWKIEAVLSGVTITPAAGTDPTVSDALRLSLHVDEEIVYDMTSAISNDYLLVPTVADLVAPASPCGDPDLVTQTLNANSATLQWSNPLSCIDAYYTHYEIDLLRLYNTSAAKSTTPRDITAKVDWTAARRYQVHGNVYSYTVPITQGSGYYLWRIRPVYSRYNGWSNDPRNWGPWSYSPANGATLLLSECDNMYSVTDPLATTKPKACFYVDIPDAPITFLHGQSNAADSNGTSRIGDSRAYLNSIGQVVQVQTLDRERSIAIGSGVVYDLNGLPSLSVLPAPIQTAGTTDLQTDYGFVPNAITIYGSGVGTDPYTAEAYDDPTLTYSAPYQISDISPFGWYHSDENPDLTVPGSQGYPFTRTLYNGDGTLRSVIPPGEPHRSSGTDELSTRTMVGRVSDQELWSVFGDESPNTDEVFRVLTTSPDNVSSVRYVTTTGQTIATALIAGGELASSTTTTDKTRITADGSRTLLNANGVLGGDGVDHHETVNTITSQHNISGGQAFDQDSLVGSTSFVLPVATTVKIEIDRQYRPGVTFESRNGAGAICFSECRHCRKLIRVVVTRVDVMPPVVKYSTLIAPPELECDGVVASIPSVAPLMDEELPPGSYVVTRSVVTNPVEGGSTAVEKAVDAYIGATAVANGLQTMLDDVLGTTGTYEERMAAYHTLRDGLAPGYNYTVSLGEEQPCLVVNLPEPEKCFVCPTSLELANTEYEMGFEAYYKQRELEQYGSNVGYDDFFTWTDPSGTVAAKYDFNAIPGDDDAESIRPFDRMVQEMLKNTSCEYDCQHLFSIWRGLVEIHLSNLHTSPPVPAYQRIDDIVETFLISAGYAGPCMVSPEVVEVADMALTTLAASKNAYKQIRTLDDTRKTDCIAMATFGGVVDWSGVALCLTAPRDADADLVDDANSTRKRPCRIPAPGSPPGDLIAYAECIKLQDKKQLVESCDERRDFFERKFRKDDPLAPDILISMRADAAVADCKAYSDPVTPGDWVEYKKRRFGYPTATPDVHGTCAEPAVLHTNASSAMELLVQYLNDEYERRRASATETICVNFASLAYDFLIGLINPDYIPECITELAAGGAAATEMECTDAEDEMVGVGGTTANPWLIRIVPGEDIVPGYFTRGGNACCDLLYTGPIRPNRKPAQIVTQMNALLDSLWGKPLTGGRPVTSSSKPVTGGAQPYLDYNSKTLAFDAFGVSNMHPSLTPIIDTALVRMYDSSLVLNGGYGPFLPITWSYYYPLVEPTDTSASRFGAFDGSAFRMVDSTRPYHNVWRTYGPLQIRMTHRSVHRGVVYDPVTTVLGWQLKSSSVPGDTVCTEVVFEYWQDGILKKIPLSVADTSQEYLSYLYTSFTTRIGRFEQVDDHRIAFRSLVNSDLTPASGLRPYRQHTRKLYVGDDEACPALDQLCDLTLPSEFCLRWDTVAPAEKLLTADLVEPKSCEQMALERLQAQLTVAWGQAVGALRTRIASEYRAACMDVSYPDPVRIRFAEQIYHYTLFYYDTKGRLVRSVAPKGVDIVPARIPTGAGSAPGHTFVSRFKVDAYGAVQTKTVPDGGVETYTYDSYGRLRFVQDAAQVSAGRVSFLKYDRYGRILATGECAVGAADPTVQPTVDNQNLPDPMHTSVRDLVLYRYDTAMSVTASTPWALITGVHAGFRQRNLTGRLSYVTSIPDCSVPTENVVRTVLSYAVGGAVTGVVEDIPQDATSGSVRMIKWTAYVSNAATGQITRVEYQKGKSADQFFRKYEYDHNGALTHAYSSRDAVHWDLDARLDYDLLGNHRRTTVGEDSVAGTDYVYTLQGQIKGINHPSLDPAADPGHDGTSGDNEHVAKDAFGMAFRYYDADFGRSHAISGYSPFNPSAAAGMPAVTGSLYGGLLGSVSMRTQALPTAPGTFQLDGQLVGETYAYDVLGRIRSTTYYTRLNIAGSPPLGDSWLKRDAGNGQAYSGAWVYDQNGNQVTFTRTVLDGAGATQTTDNASVNLVTTSNVVKTINDIGVTGYDDARTESNTAASTDTRGRSIRSDGITTARNLTWTDNDLVKTASQGTMSSTFLYDGFGNLVRTSARQTGGGTVASTYYVSGGAEIYELGDGGSPVIREWTIAGGVSRDVATAVINSNGPYYRHIGNKRYELTDHLGSVRGIIPDIKLPDGATFKSELYNVAEYDAYGMERPFRSREIVAAGFYRYGFQGMRRADGLTATISASRNEYVTPFRLYDAKMGTWMSHDPITKVDVSPYEGLGSNPISIIDPWGLDPVDPPGGQQGVSQGAGEGPQTFGSPSEVASSTKTPDAGAAGGLSIPTNSAQPVPQAHQSLFGLIFGTNTPALMPSKYLRPDQTPSDFSFSWWLVGTAKGAVEMVSVLGQHLALASRHSPPMPGFSPLPSANEDVLYSPPQGSLIMEHFTGDWNGPHHQQNNATMLELSSALKTMTPEQRSEAAGRFFAPVTLEWLTVGLLHAVPSAGRLARVPYRNDVSAIHPDRILFSQTSVNDVADLAQSMRMNGWVGEPIDVVRMEGNLVAYDNTRVLAASRANINVQAVVHEATDAFPASRWGTRSGLPPSTWGEAVKLRIDRQTPKLYRSTYPNGSPVTGSKE